MVFKTKKEDTHSLLKPEVLSVPDLQFTERWKNNTLHLKSDSDLSQTQKDLPV